jgi:hypothetical protein
MDTLFLSRGDVAMALSLKELINATGNAYVSHVQRAFGSPPLFHLILPRFPREYVPE